MSPQLIDGLIIAGFAAIVASVVAILNRVRALEIAVAETKIQVGPLWAQVQSKVAQELHHDDPRYAEMDTLLEDLVNLRITTANRIHLKVLLLERAADNSVSPEERKSAELMISVMEKVVVEAGATLENADSP